MLSTPLLITLMATATAQAKDYKADAGPLEVGVVTFEWQDDKRNREVPARVYYPKTGGPCPVIIFSHGLGGSRDGYAYLGRHWASHGYVSVHLTHKGSDSSVWQGQTDVMAALKKAVADPQASLNRPQDVSFAIDQLTKLNQKDSPLAGRLDLDKIGMAGHSFGAFTTMAVAGQRYFPLGRETSMGDPRVKAAIPMSPNPPRKKEEYARSFAAVTIPCLHMTGTLDDSPVGETKAAERRVPFDHLDKSDQYLVLFKDGDHMVYSGRAGIGSRVGNAAGFGGDPKKDPRFQALTRMATMAFWDAYLKGDKPAKTWLAEGGLKEALGADGTVEKKMPVK
jgi:dienelactone hydrolase